MIEKKQIDLNVQRALYRKIDALNRLRLKEIGRGTENFFLGDALEASDNSNPIEQHIYRSCFAKVSVAVPEKTTNENNESTVVRKPISISSYLNQEFDENDKLKSMKNVDTPLTFSEGISERVGEDKTSNLFRGHSGITSIKVTQQSYFMNKFDIGWVCPDPKFYEDVFSKKFLKLGAFLAIEFGWGIDDKDIELPSLTIEEMRKLVQDGVRERNLKSAGNYYCNVGQVIKFDWKVMEGGGYAGSLEVISKGGNMLLQPTQKSGQNSDETLVPIKSIVEKQRKLEELRANPNLSKKDREKAEQQLGGIDNERQYYKLIQNSVGFQTVMRNLDKVIDEYVGFRGSPTDPNRGLTFLGFEKNPYNYDKSSFGEVFKGNKFRGALGYHFKDGAMKIAEPPSFYQPGSGTDDISLSDNREGKGKDLPPENFANGRYFCSWGWFEDIILNSFFELQDGDITLQEIKSSKKVYNPIFRPIDTSNIDSSFVNQDGTFDNDKIFQEAVKNGPSFQPSSEQTNPLSQVIENQNRCVSSEYLYSTGLDGVILPGKIHPVLENGFNQVDDEHLKKIPKYYSDKDRIDMMRILLYYQAIDEAFKPFGIETEKYGCTSTNNVGIIRNMVFPIEMLQEHFQNAGSVRQGLRNFWAAVSNQYGGFWDFKVGQDQNQTTRIGVSELYHDRLKNQPSTPEDAKKRQGSGRIVADLQFDKIFTFSVFSKDSIVKSFDVNLDLSAEASTLATYGHFTKGDTSHANTINDLPIEAWNILNQIEGEEDLLTKEQMDSFKKIGSQEIAKNVKFPIDNEGKGKAYQYGYKKNKPALTEILNNEGLKFFEIKEIKDDQATQMEKVNNKRAAYINGVGLYNRDGNLSEKFKQIMVYLLTKSKEAGSGSLIQKAKITLPISLSMSFDGVGGLEVGDCFRIDYLPKVYRENCFFMTTKVNHSVDNTGWTTDIEAMMVVDMENYWVDNQDKLNNTQLKLSELFRLNDGMGVKFEDIDRILNRPYGGGENYDAAIQKLNKLYEDFNTQYSKYQRADGEFFSTLKKRVRLGSLYEIYNETQTHFDKEITPLREVLDSTLFTKLQRDQEFNLKKFAEILSEENKNYIKS